jgi:fructokinase
VIVVAGEALVDVVGTADGVVATLGGAPYNVARACGRLGAPTVLASCLSLDGFGKRLRSGLSECGVADDLLQFTDRPTTLALADVDDEGVATYHFYAEATSAPLLTPGPLPEPATALVTGGLALALEPMAHHIERFVTEAGAGVMVVIDVNVRSAAITNRNAYLERLHTVLHRADVVKVSHEDLAYLEPEATAHDAAQSLLQRGARVVLVTNGAHDTTIVTGAGSVAVPVQSVSVVDTIGAGDAFTAGFVVRCVESRAPLAELSEPPTIVPMVQAAHAVAAAVVGKRGCDPPTREELPADWSSH